MKKIILFLGLVFFALTTAFAQNKCREISPTSRIVPYAIETGFYKTTVLIFPAPISKGGIDRGSADIIAKVVSGVSNILKLKANRKGFPETNLTVITTDGKVYPFVVNYSDNPPDAPINMGKQQTEETRLAAFRNRKINSEQIKRLAKSVVLRKSFLHKKTRYYRVKLTLTGIYSCKDVLFYRFILKNKSHIDYTVDFSRFYIRDKKRVKRTAQQEKEIKPLLVYYEYSPVMSGKADQVIVMAFHKFTIADHKNFVIQLFEKNGDRSLILKINGHTLAKAQTIHLIP